MQDKIVVITGATSGIGASAARRLAEAGARIIFIVRDAQRGAATLTLLRHANPNAAHAYYVADLSRMREVQRVGEEIAGALPRIDVLINNAGALFARRLVTDEGLEMTFALNHMAYFVLSRVLTTRLSGAVGARIVNTASEAHRGAVLDFDDLQGRKAWSGLGAYGRSKLCNILFTRELARRLAGTGVLANSLHPGFVASRFGDNNGGLIKLALPVAKLFAISPERGADTIVHLASASAVDAVTGLYFDRCVPVPPSAAALDDRSAERLWEDAERTLKGLGVG